MLAKIIPLKPRSSPLHADWDLTAKTIPATPEIARLVGGLLGHRLVGKLFTGRPEAHIPQDYAAFAFTVFTAFAQRDLSPPEIAALTGIPAPTVAAFVDGLIDACRFEF